jgi:hypothetical protein
VRITSIACIDNSDVSSAPIISSAAIVGNLTIRIIWSSPNDTGGGDTQSALTNFLLQRATSSMFTVPSTITLPVSILQYDDSAVSKSVQYFYRVQATNPAGSGSFSETLSAVGTSSFALLISYNFSPSQCSDWNDFVYSPSTVGIFRLVHPRRHWSRLV